MPGIDAASGAEPPQRLELARLCQRSSTGGRVQSGLLDQLASLFGGAGQAQLIDFRTLEVTALPLVLGDHRLVTLDSGERHENSASGYNQRRRECAEACAVLGIDSLRDATLDDLAPCRSRFAGARGM